MPQSGILICEIFDVWGKTLITILRKFFGVILMAIGVKLLTTNLGTLISGLNI